MAIFILLAFISFFIGISGWLTKNGNGAPYRYGFVLTLLFFFLWVNITTEGMSYFHLLHRNGFIWLWILTASAGLLTSIYYARYLTLPEGKQFRQLPAIIVCVILLITALIATCAFPTNWDSMSYHLSRVMHWIDQGSVAHYTTNIDRQLSQPPLAEYAILHLYALSFIPALANWVQWMAFVGCIVGVSLVLRQLKADNKTQWLGACITATIPMAILQSTSTQNDLVVSFFLLSSILFLFHFIQERGHFRHLIFMHMSLILALLTKGTAYIYALPVVLTFLTIGIIYFNTKWARLMIYMSMLVSLILMWPTLGRNIQSFDKPLGPDYALRNDPISAQALLINTPENMAMHLRSPFPIVNNALTSIINSYADLVAGNKGTDTYTWSYSPDFSINYFSTHEDIAGNAVHVLLLTLCIVFAITIKRLRKKDGLLLLTGMVILMISAFSLLLKWQYWHVRLHTPIFIIGSIIIAKVMQSWSTRRRTAVVSLLLISALPFLFLNQTRPITWKENIFNSNHAEMLRLNNPDFYTPYVAISNIIQEHNCKHVQLRCGGDGWEFPWWVSGQEISGFTISHELGEDGVEVSSRKNAASTVDAIIVQSKDTKAPSLMHKDMAYALAYTEGELAVYLKK